MSAKTDKVPLRKPRHRSLVALRLPPRREQIQICLNPRPTLRILLTFPNRVRSSELTAFRKVCTKGIVFVNLLNLPLKVVLAGKTVAKLYAEVLGILVSPKRPLAPATYPFFKTTLTAQPQYIPGLKGHR